MLFPTNEMKRSISGHQNYVAEKKQTCWIEIMKNYIVHSLHNKPLIQVRKANAYPNTEPYFFN